MKANRLKQIKKLRRAGAKAYVEGKSFDSCKSISPYDQMQWITGWRLAHTEKGLADLELEKEDDWDEE